MAVNEAPAADAASKRAMRELVIYFLRLGFMGFGGPVALVGQMERELVAERKWLSPDQMREAVAVCQSLPGPPAFQVGIFISYLRGGLWGAWAGGWAFILPNFVIVAAQLVGVTMASPSLAETASFETSSVGGPPKGWLLTMTGKGAPKWTIEQGDAGEAVLKQSGKATYPLALKEGTNIRDGFMEVKFKPISGSEDRAGGIIWRARDANNYYVVRANALEDNVVLYKTVNGVRSSLDLIGQKGGNGVKTAVALNQWHTLRIEFAGARFNVVFNGKRLFAVEDVIFPEAGMVGFWTKADSVTVFSGFTYGERQ